MKGHHIRATREIFGLTVAEMARILRATPEEVVRWECGSEPIPASVAALVTYLLIEAQSMSSEMEQRMFVSTLKAA